MITSKKKREVFRIIGQSIDIVQGVQSGMTFFDLYIYI